MAAPNGKSYSVLILGAGIAGLSAAHRLASCPDRVHDVAILEARDRIGGRVYVKRHRGVQVHMGAQWIHQYCPENSLINMAKEHGLVDDCPPLTAGDMNPQSFFDTEHVFSSSGQLLPQHLVEKAAKIYHIICKYIGNELKDNSLASDPTIRTVDDLFERVAARELKKLEHQLDTEQIDVVATALYGCKNELAHFVCGELKECSLKAYMNCSILPGDDIDLPLDLIDFLAGELPQHWILPQHQVIQIDWSDDNLIRVTCAVGQENRVHSFLTERVICSLPIGVLQRHNATLFVPNLPDDKVDTIFSICPGMTSKYFISWKKPWKNPFNSPVMLAWSKDELSSILLPDEWYKGIIKFSVFSEQSNMMIAWIGGRSSQIVDRLPDQQVIKDIGFILRKFTGNPHVPDPDYLLRECWTADPFTLGAYSFPKASAKPDVFKNMSKPVPSQANPRILFAGEATHDNLWSFLHGAQLSGKAAADQILNLNN